MADLPRGGKFAGAASAWRCAVRKSACTAAQRCSHHFAAQLVGVIAHGISTLFVAQQPLTRRRSLSGPRMAPARHAGPATIRRRANTASKSRLCRAKSISQRSGCDLLRRGRSNIQIAAPINSSVPLLDKAVVEDDIAFDFVSPHDGLEAEAVGLARVRNSLGCVAPSRI